MSQIPNRNRESLRSELTTLERMLAETPADRAIERTALEARLRRVRGELAGLDERRAEPPATRAEERLIEEWPRVLGTMILLSRTTPDAFSGLTEEALDGLAAWNTDPVGCVRDFLTIALRLDWQMGDLSDRAGDATSAVYFLVYLGPSYARARQLLDVYAPLLRPGLWDAQLRYRLEFAFFEDAWSAVFDEGGLDEPSRDEDFDWPGSLNALSPGERAELLAFAGMPELVDPARPPVAAWNERWMDLAWLWSDEADR